MKEALAKYDVTADQIFAVVQNKVANAVLAANLSYCGLLLSIVPV